MPSKPLTQEQRQDAARLSVIFAEHKHRHGLTQAVLADKLGFSVQSTVSQYLKGKIPLNVAAAIKFAECFNCRVADFSPSLQADIDKIALFASSVQMPTTATSASETVWKQYQNADYVTKIAIDLLLLTRHERIRLTPEAQAAIVLLESAAPIALQTEKAKKIA